jgi:hypothetical protein
MDRIGNGCDDVPSTTWRWKLCRVEAAPAQGTSTASAKQIRTRRRLLTRTYRADVRLEYRGGPECEYLVVARGRVWRVPGWMCIADVAARVGLPPGP